VDGEGADPRPGSREVRLPPGSEEDPLLEAAMSELADALEATTGSGPVVSIPDPWRPAPRSMVQSSYGFQYDKETVVETVTISPKYQIVIPKAIRESLNLRPGQKIQTVQYGNRIELIPVVPIEEMRGFLRGLDTDVFREEDRM